MSGTLQLVKSTQYNGIKFDCYAQEGNSKDFWATRTQIGQLLEYEYPTEAIGKIHNRNKERLDKFSRVTQIDLPVGGRQMTTVYNFKGLLEICRFSNKPKADAVMDFLWNVAEEIRLYGFYAQPEIVEKVFLNPDFLIKLLQKFKTEKEKTAVLESKIEKDRPKVLFSEAVSSSQDSILIGNLAKILRQNGIDIGQNRLFEWFRENGFLIRRKGELWNMPTQKSLNAGLFIIKKNVIKDKDGNQQIYHTVKVTGKGQIYFVDLFLGNKSKQLELA